MRLEEMARNSFALWVMSHLKRCGTAAGRSSFGESEDTRACFPAVRGEFTIIQKSIGVQKY